MASTYVNDLRIEEQATGENSGTWGTKVNSAFSQIAEAFSYGTKQLAADSNETFTMPDGTSDGTRSLYLKITSAGSLTATRTVTLGPNTVSKLWIIENATTGSQSITIAQGSGGTVTIPTGAVKMVYSDGAGSGAAVVDALVDLDLTGTTKIATANIDGGSIDGTTIGASTAAAGTFTTGQFDTSLNVDGTVTADGGTIVSTGSDAFSSKAVGGYAIQAYQDATSSGHTALDLRSDATAGTRYLIRGYNDAAGTPTEVFSVGADGTVTADGLTVDGDVTVTGASAISLSSEQHITYQTTSTNATAGDHIFKSYNTEIMRIDGNNNRVGIGTSSPSAKLDIFDSGAGNANSAAIELTNYDYGVGETGQSVSIEALVRNDGGGSSTTGKIVFGKDSDYSSAANRDGNIQFYTNQSNSVTEAMRIDSSGNLLVGTTDTTLFSNTSGEGLSVVNNELGIAKSDTCAYFNRMGSDGTTVKFFNRGGNVGNISTTSTATSYNTSSDQRLKENIVDAPSASDDIDAIQVRSFDWKVDGSHQKYGMVAQELVAVAPEAVSQPEDPEEMMGVDYSKLVPMMLKEIQSLRARVAQLEGAN